MVLLKEKCGKMHQDILVIGEIIAKKVSEFSFIRMVINMKVCGPWIRSMGRGLIGEVKVRNYEENIQEIGLKIKSTEEVHSFLKTVIVMMDIG
jgi:hypothetical protein